MTRMMTVRTKGSDGDETGGYVVKSRQSVAVSHLAGLERSARLAGESFGYEETAAVAAPLSSRLLWWLAALAAGLGLAVLAWR